MNYKIAKPCMQRWNEMTPSVNGRFCIHCQKEVYDLTTGKTLPDTTGNFCGRIKADAPAKEISFKKLLWRQNPVKYILFTFLLLFTRNIKAQLLNKIDTSSEGDTNQNREDSTTKTVIISGVLTDEKTKETISLARIKAYDNLNNFLGMTITDVNGVYILKLNKVLIKGKNIRLQAMYGDYDPINITDIPINSLKKNINIKLSQSEYIDMVTGKIVMPIPNNSKK